MGFLRRKRVPDTGSLDEIVGQAKGLIEQVRPDLEPDEDFIPTAFVDGPKGGAIHALMVDTEELSGYLAKVTSGSYRYAFHATAWQVDGVDDNDVRASEHPDRFEAVILQAFEAATGRYEVWRARLERRPGAAPDLAPWQLLESGHGPDA